MIKFKEWLKIKESGTFTGNIAGFSRIALPMASRISSFPVTHKNACKKKKKNSLIFSPVIVKS
jgi:hypothetical protein